jgi:hypothetical protein
MYSLGFEIDSILALICKTTQKFSLHYHSAQTSSPPSSSPLSRLQVSISRLTGSSATPSLQETIVAFLQTTTEETKLLIQDLVLPLSRIVPCLR